MKNLIDFRNVDFARPEGPAPQKKHFYNIIPNNEVNSICAECGSDNIIESENGCYVCTSCGLTVDGIQILRYDNPYSEIRLQNSVNITKRSTQLGTSAERRSYLESSKFNRMSKIQNISKEYNDFILQIAQRELSRILTILHLPESLKKGGLIIINKVWNKLEKGSKGRNPEKLTPVILFMLLKVKAININLVEFFDAIRCDIGDFKDILMSASLHYSAYIRRDRKQLIKKKISEITEYFNLDKSFFNSANRILSKFYPLIKNTKDDVIVGVVSALSIIGLDINTVSVSKLCEKIGIKMSTINYQVKYKIINKLNISGFKSLIRSSLLLKTCVLNIVLVKIELNGDENNNNDKAIVFNPRTGQSISITNVSLKDLREILTPEFMQESDGLEIIFYFGRPIRNNKPIADFLRGSEIICYFDDRKKRFLRYRDIKGPPYT